MSVIRGYYYDGRSVARRDVEVSRQGNCLCMTGEGIEARYPVTRVQVSPTLGTISRAIRFPDGSVCEVPGSADLEGALGLRERAGARLLSRGERSLTLIVAALVLTAMLLSGLVKYGIPAAARRVADTVPRGTEMALGRETLAVLDRIAFAPSALTEARRRDIDSLFRGMLRELPDGTGYRLEFRSGDRVGANAFALPSGIIVVTDALTKLARSDEELSAVFAHESGHVRSRHALRHVLQNSATGLVIALVTGDVLSITSLSATLPTVLIDATYAREFEREADDAAVAFLDRRGIPRKVYADMLARLQAEQERREGTAARNGHGRSLADWFSTHPVTEERIGRVMGMKKISGSP